MKNIRPTLNEIIKIVAIECDVKITDIKKDNRIKNIAYARHYFCYIARTFFYTCKEIGIFINKSHAIVVLSFYKIKEELNFYKEVKRTIEELNFKINNIENNTIIVEYVDLLTLSKNYTDALKNCNI